MTTTYSASFFDDIWTFEKFSPRLLEALTAKDNLIVLKHGAPPYAVVLGVPHQAAVGVEHIAELRPETAGGKRASDENAASFALAAYSILCGRSIPCKLVISAHATDHDPNKDLESPYCKEAFSEQTRMLFECHGSGGNRRQELELSAGSNQLGNAQEFGRQLAASLDYHYSLAAQVDGGNRMAKSIARDGEVETVLTLPALETTSLRYAGEQGIPALHIEAKPRFRIPADGSNSVSPDGLKLGRALVNVFISRNNS